MISDILITLFLVLLNGFFVAAEFAIVKVRHSQIDTKANQGNSVAKVAQHIIQNLDAYLSACQLGITLASLALGWIGEPIVMEMLKKLTYTFGYEFSDEQLKPFTLPIAFGLITTLHIVLGEQAPKTAAIRNPLPTTLTISIPLRIFYFVFRPFIWLLNALSNLTLRLFGINRSEHLDSHTEEELRMLLTESEESGAIKQSEHDLIQNVFEFDDRMVKHIFVPRTRVTAIDIDDEHQAIVQKVFDEGYSRLPVYKDSIDNILGVLHVKDIYKAERSGKEYQITDILRPAYYVPLSKRINDLLREFQRQHIQMAIVTNEFGGTEGIVTMEDIIEELVGEIQDEYDEEKPAVEKKSETEYIVNAKASIIDVNDLLPIQLPESQDYETISGLVNYLFGGIPAVNEKISFGGYEITILKRFKHSVESVCLKVIDNESIITE